MADLTVRITATDDASAAIERTARSMEALASRSKNGNATIAASTREATQAVRAMTTGLLSEFSPALATSVQQLDIAASRARGFGVAAGTVTVALAAAAIGLGAYVRSQNQMIETQARLNLAVRSFDVGGLTAQLATASLEMERYHLRAETWIGSAKNLFQGLLSMLGLTTTAMKDLDKAQKALLQVLPIERERTLAQVYGEEQKALAALLQVEAQRAVKFGDLADFERQHQGIAQALSNEATATERLLRAQATIEISAAQARNAPEAQIALIRERLEAQIRILAIQTSARFETLQEAGRAGRLAALEVGRPALPLQTDIEFDIFRPLTPAESQKVQDIMHAGQVQDLQLAQSRLRAQQEMVDLTARQRAELALQVIEAGRLVAVEQARGHLGKESLANIEAAVQAQNVQAAELARTDLAAGLARGFQDTAEELDAVGARMQAFARDTASAMQQSFSDQFFAVITGQFKDLPEVGRRFGAAMIRAITDQFAALFTGRLFRTLSGTLGGGGGGGLAALVPGLGLGGGLLTGAAGAGGGGISDAALYSQAAAIESTVMGGGGAYPGFSAASLPSTFTFGGALNRFAISPSMSYLATPSTSAGVFGGAGLTYGQALGAAGGVLGLGLTIYSALQGPPTAQNIATSAASGAISGAVIAAALGATGWGLVIGVIAGAILGGGAAAFGKGEDVEATQRRQQRNQRRAREILQELANVVSNTLDPEEAARVRISSGNTAGGLIRRIAEGQVAGRFAGGPWNWPADTKYQKLVDVLAALGIASEELPKQGGRRGLEGVGELLAAGGVDFARQILDRALDRLAQVEQLLARSPFFFEEALDGVTRRTFLQSTDLGRSRATGQQLQISPDLLALLLNDDDAVELVLRRLRAVDRDRDLGIVGVEEFAR